MLVHRPQGAEARARSAWTCAATCGRTAVHAAWLRRRIRPGSPAPRRQAAARAARARWSAPRTSRCIRSTSGAAPTRRRSGWPRRLAALAGRGWRAGAGARRHRDPPPGPVARVALRGVRQGPARLLASGLRPPPDRDRRRSHELTGAHGLARPPPDLHAPSPPRSAPRTCTSTALERLAAQPVRTLARIGRFIGGEAAGRRAPPTRAGGSARSGATCSRSARTSGVCASDGSELRLTPELRGGGRGPVPRVSNRALGGDARPRRGGAGLPVLILHIGLPKTGTTLLQHRIFARAPGVTFVHRARGGEAAAAAADFRLYARVDRLRAVLLPASSAPTAERVRRQGRPVLLTEENISVSPARFWQDGGATPAGLARRLAALAGGLDPALAAASSDRRHPAPGPVARLALRRIVAALPGFRPSRFRPAHGRDRGDAGARGTARLARLSRDARIRSRRCSGATTCISCRSSAWSPTRSRRSATSAASLAASTLSPAARRPGFMPAQPAVGRRKSLAAAPRRLGAGPRPRARAGCAPGSPPRTGSWP